LNGSATTDETERHVKNSEKQWLEGTFKIKEKIHERGRGVAR